MTTPVRLRMHTADLAEEELALLKELFPDAITETIVGDEVVRAIDADVLQQEINAHVVEGREERYQFTWPDKNKSRVLANTPTTKSLRPSRDRSVEFDNTQNLYIEGDNLDVLKALRETYLGKVKMIYIDPPYNTGNDFVYEDDFAIGTSDFLVRDQQIDAIGNRLVANTVSNGRFHTDWLNMIYPRLRLAKDFLSDDGVIFISIDDNEVENLKKVCNEIFGEENFITILVWHSSTGGGIRAKYVNISHQHILLYAKSTNDLDTLYAPLSEEAVSMYKSRDERGLYRDKDFAWKNSGTNPNQRYEVECPDGELIRPKPGYLLRFVRERFEQELKSGTVTFKRSTTGPFVRSDGRQANWTIYIKKYLGQGEGAPTSVLPRSLVGLNNDGTSEIQEIFGERVFEFPKSVRLLSYILKVGTNKDSIVLDFFSGSATTAHAVMQLNAEDGGNRKFIMVQVPEITPEDSDARKAGYNNICEIGKERIRRAGKKIKAASPTTTATLDTGFRVFKLDSSNMKDVYYTPEEYAKLNFNLDGFVENIKSDRNDEDLLFQVMLEIDIPLSAKVEREGDLFSVNDGYLLACFGKVDDELLTAIAKRRPFYAAFRDSSFVKDASLANFSQIFNTYSPDTKTVVL